MGVYTIYKRKWYHIILKPSGIDFQYVNNIMYITCKTQEEYDYLMIFLKIFDKLKWLNVNIEQEFKTCD